jgi:GTP pyrophosphokinase
MKKFGLLENIFLDHHYRPSRLRDWISSKSTGYEALHITVMGPKGWVEVHSAYMDEIAEKGYAAHYKYKNGATPRSWMFG